jgi:prepilin signal peptidase PulO-like enzyme (type II secretory pathway)
VKLAAFMGAWLGVEVVPALFLGSLLALVPAVVILARHGKAGRKMGVPFGPFLAAGAVIALFSGEQLLDLWLQ